MGLNHICVSSSPLNQTHLESKSLLLLHQGHSFAFYKILRSKTKNTFPHIFRLPLSMRAIKQALLVPLAGHVVEGKSLLPLHMAVFRAHVWNSSVVIQHSKIRENFNESNQTSGKMGFHLHATFASSESQLSSHTCPKRFRQELRGLKSDMRILF